MSLDHLPARGPVPPAAPPRAPAMSRSLFNVRRCSALALAALLAAAAARADVIIFKDGYTIYGVKTVKEREIVLDPAFGPFIGAKANGVTALDDGPRWVVFPAGDKQVADVGETNRFRDFAAYTRERTKGETKLPSDVINPIKQKDWDFKEWKMEVRYTDGRNPQVKHTVGLQITVITPYYIRVGSWTHGNVARYFLTKEWGPELVRKFIVNHPDLIEQPGKPDASRREKLIRFWIQADFLDEADKDLERLQADLPAEKERYAKLKSEVNALRAERLMAETERAHDSGRHQWAIRALDELPKAFPKEDVPRPVAQKANTMRAEYARRMAQFSLGHRYLDKLIDQVKKGGNQQFLVDAATAVRKEVHLDTLSRLEMFLTLTERAEKDAVAGRRPSQSPEELLAAAITGWHLGKVAAEPRVATAYKVWMGRQMALDYFRTPAAGNRIRALEKYLAADYALAYDELEKLVSLIPPPDAPETVPTGLTTVKLPPSVQNPIGVTFLLRLPDEYQPGRSYPLLLLLPDPDMDRGAQALLDRFADLPSRHGYIVAAVQWWDPMALVVPKYGYSKEEHAVLFQALSHLRRAYQVDSDRVFLWGNGQGGSMALDVGASHPDQFAGILTTNAPVHQPLYVPSEYWVNFFQLPVYMVMGDKFDPSVGAIRMISERWMPKGFPALVVSYKGRGAEWFSAEPPFAFDWMSRKRRADPGKVLGPPRFPGRTDFDGFSSVRMSDNRFHWLSGEIKPERAVGAAKAFETAKPVKFSGKIVDGNTVQVKAIGTRELTIWFGKGMVDYTKPVKVQVTDAKPLTKDITPQIPVLMEDLYERADRQRPYFAKVEVKMP
jgi:pimeloyl-ACP methyl ester carboxylesterase